MAHGQERSPQERLELEEMERDRQCTVNESLRIMRDHLQRYLQRNPEGTYTGWIADLHPENVAVDPRLLRDDNPWMTLWSELGGRRLFCPTRRGGASGADLIGVSLQRPPIGWGGLVDVTLGAVFTIATIAVALVFEVVRGVLLGLARTCGLGRRLGDHVPIRQSASATCCKKVSAALRVVLWLPELIIWFAAVLVLVVGTLALELMAVVAALSCGVFALSPMQAQWMHSVIGDAGFATQAATRRSLVLCRVLQWDQEAHVRLVALGAQSARGPRFAFAAFAAATVCDGFPRCPLEDVSRTAAQDPSLEAAVPVADAESEHIAESPREEVSGQAI